MDSVARGFQWLKCKYCPSWLKDLPCYLKRSIEGFAMIPLASQTAETLFICKTRADLKILLRLPRCDRCIKVIVPLETSLGEDDFLN